MSRQPRGFTLLEMVAVLGVVVILLGILTPMVLKYIEDARRTRASRDVEVIGEAINLLNSQLGVPPGWISGASLTPTSPFVDLLITTEGEMPGTSGPAAADWALGSRTQGADGGYDFLENHLQTNGPSYPTTGRFRWRGPYLERIQADPWGKKYLVNIEFAKPGAAANAVFVLSAGPDGLVETAFSQPKTGSVTLSGDDIGFRLR